MASRPVIYIPDDAPVVMANSAAYAALQERADVRYWDTLPGPELVERIKDAEIVINIRSSCRFTAGIFDACPRLKLLSIWGTGTDHVDLAAAARHGVTITNTPGVAAIAIAEHCLMLMLAVARRIIDTDRAVRQGHWPRAQVAQMHGKTLGVIGLGAIGRQFARLGQAIGMNVITWTMNPKPELGFEHVKLDELYRRSDVVSLHLRLSEQTTGMVGREQFQMMKPSAIFINTARGPIVDEFAMLEALVSARIAGAGLDVFTVEPLPADSPIKGLPNVVLTPHSAGITPETLEAGLAMSIDNVWKWLATRS
jgi:phosphoglycerate dehydrogenase-like enzyme